MPFIQDGFRSTIRIAGFVNILLRERELQPPEIDGRGMINTTTMRNTMYDTQVPKYLTKLGDLTVVCNYDPFVYSTILVSVLNRVLLYTVTFPDNATMAFYAAMQKFTPQSLKEGEFPLAEVKISPTMMNNLGIETTPTFVAGPNVGSFAWPPVPRPVG